VLLQTDQLSSLDAIGHDEIADALNALADSSPVDFTIDNAIVLCEQAMSLLGPPEIIEKSTCEARRPKSEHEADAYDEYFPVVRVDGSPRHVFAWSLLSAFRDLLVEAKAGTSLTPVEWSVIRQGFVELALLITGYEDS
jgi:hypothetical protein